MSNEIKVNLYGDSKVQAVYLTPEIDLADLVDLKLGQTLRMTVTGIEGRPKVQRR